MIAFDWNMSKGDYERLKNAVINGTAESDNYYGCVVFGDLCIDVYVDDCLLLAFAAGYETGDEYQTEGTWYGTWLDGTPLSFNYEQNGYLDNVNINAALESTSDFESFKNYVEQDILATLDAFPEEKEKAERPNLYWSRKEQK